MIASFQQFAAIAQMSAGANILSNASSAMALEKNTKKHRTDLMTPKDFKTMETIIIITFGVMLIIALLQIRKYIFDNQVLINKLDAEEKANKSNVKKQVVLLNQIEKLKYNSELKDKALKKAKESDSEYINSKWSELETKYKSSLLKIVERDEVLRTKDIKIMALSADANHFNKAYIVLDNEVNQLQNSIDEKEAMIKLRDSQIFKYEKSNKQLAEELKKRDKIMEDAWNVVRESEKIKDIAIQERISAVKLCKESVATVAQLRAELDNIEALLTKYIPQPSLLP